MNNRLSGFSLSNVTSIVVTFSCGRLRKRYLWSSYMSFHTAFVANAANDFLIALCNV